MTKTVFIDGAAGTTGLEIAERLEGRAEFELIVLDDARRKDDDARAEALNAADFVILCLPDDAAKAAVGMIRNDTTRVIDASSAHRVAPDWTYGFPEVIGREAVAAARFVSNPGCYPTGFIALVAPLVKAGLLPADWPYVCHAVSGYSGGGKALIGRFEEDRDIAFRAYGLALGHKHVPEMTTHVGLAHAPIFAPAVVPAHRGMLVEVPLHLSMMSGAGTPADLRAALSGFYAGSEIVTVVDDQPDELLLRASMEPVDSLTLRVLGAKDGSQARLVATLDNLGKGASGAAVQNLNLMAGLPETAGLRL
ncbi:N-acetyl-gamma-glutamyl-phosphate reductase [Novosphingobium aerophilum]|uniref:N-acetyl-gamma-glutamyl-phosphate reductase n=1 Tax=Novosphingobium TaxID=165696 RepID=UPI0006C85D4A|nr:MULTISPECIES: N-acetyl-gamma-glutamyl-phosphate reductase [unclassified Novosphingobium]KPH64488.1 N-acetyl-gamma-glutamyl-phosphate reductase [Novosphingobium sp. ST904]TCM31134.1 N-acetyl-gamma-glutamyl-phosphate reductase [Novosphingobium sp. ST904]WRT93576.1 N-acetyl-gamma-glutamyl-phosphate reductase [Novosphingobium sp. RL4]